MGTVHELLAPLVTHRATYGSFTVEVAMLTSTSAGVAGGCWGLLGGGLTAVSRCYETGSSLVIAN
jgi:hypothetical protein